MSNPSLTPIYNQLNGTDNYHPFSAETFADWTSEAGDTVVITRDGVDYAAPIQSQTIRWRGQQTITMESGGLKEREAVEKMSNRKYAKGGGGRSAGRTARGKNFTFEANVDHLLYEVEDPEAGLLGRMELTEQAATILYQKTGVNSLGQDETLYSLQTQTAGQVSTIVAKTGINSLGQNETLYSEISQEHDRISLVVQGSGPSASIKIGSIVDGINASAVGINADRVYIGNLSDEDLNTWASEAANGTGVFANYLTVRALTSEELTTILANIGSADITNLTATNMFADYIKSDGSVHASQFVVDGSGETLLRVANITKNQAGDTITITFVDGTSWDFSKSTSQRVTLSGAWSGRTFLVTASPSSAASPSTVGATIWNEIVRAGSRTYDPTTKKVMQDFIVYAEENGEAGHQILRQNLYIYGDDAYDDGYTNGSPVRGAAGGRSGSTYNWDFAITKGDGTVTMLSIDSSAIYSDARVGYYSQQQYNTHYQEGIIEGESHFTLATVTLQGATCAQHPVDTSTRVRLETTNSTLYAAGSTSVTGRGTSVTAREVLSSGGTAYYQAGSSTLYYMAGTSTVVGRGDSVTAREVLSSGGTPYYESDGSATVYPGNGGSFTPQGSAGPKLYYAYTQKTLYQKNSDNTYSSVGMHNWYYTSSSGTQYYNAGSGTKYDRGTGYTVYKRKTSAVRLGASDTYYKGNGGTKTVQGGETYITPVSGSPVRLGDADTYYKGDGASGTLQPSSSVSARKVVSSGGALYYQDDSNKTVYEAGTTYSTTYYTKNT